MVDDDVDEWAARLRTAMRTGKVLDLAADLSPLSILRNPTHADIWGRKRRIPAAALRVVLTDRDLAVDPHGLRIKGARITGPVDLENVQFNHPLHLTESHVEHDIDLTGSTLKELHLCGSHVTSLALDGATMTGDLVAGNGFKAGTVRAVGATILGQLNLSDATLDNSGRDALLLDLATIAGGLYTRGKFVAYGKVRAVGATIGGVLDLGGAVLTNPGDTALDLDLVTLSVGLYATDGCRVEGTVRAVGATIGKQLNFRGASITAPTGSALLLDGASIDGDLVANGGFTAIGEVRALGATIGGQLDLSGATLTNQDGTALTLDGATVTGELFASDGFAAIGEVRALGATIGGQLDLSGATLTNPDGTALTLESSTIATLRLAPTRVSGTIDLTRTTITDLRIPDNSIPDGPLIATGWQITDVHGQIRADRDAATRWLQTTPSKRGFTVQPWHAMAEVYDRNGQPADARRLRFVAANKVTEHAPWYSKPLRWTYRVVAGHGYYPLLAAVWLVIALVLGTALVTFNRGDFVPTVPASARIAAATHAPDTPPLSPITAHETCDRYPDYPCFNQATYTLASVIPAALGNPKPDWTTKSGASLVVTWGLPILRILSWIFTAILLAGVTGLLRKT
ncbi:hypothetical protein HG717_22225 [Rhodococcus erythropolis]|uniref:hypothetical protein n=1 Tax=Rhodococcus TaxID=1827 RepID=UPI0015F385AF|nr:MULTISPECIES: hypothetical protein [Rhodococcus]MBY6386617.1 hypothetical protein [Rhodococcus erythropolis]